MPRTSPRPRRGIGLVSRVGKIPSIPSVRVWPRVPAYMSQAAVFAAAVHRGEASTLVIGASACDGRTVAESSTDPAMVETALISMLASSTWSKEVTAGAGPRRPV